MARKQKPTQPPAHLRPEMLPHDKEAEQGVLGAILYNNPVTFQVSEALTPEMFFSPAHRDLYTAMLEMTEDQDPIDEITLGARLREKGKLEACGGLVYIAELIDCTPVTANALVYAEIVVKRWQARETIRACAEAVEHGYKTGDMDGQGDKLALAIRRINERGFQRPPRRLIETVGEFDQWYQSTAPAFRCHTHTPLDNVLGGIPEDRPLVIAARTGRGKSALMLQIARVNAEHGATVLFIDLEMGQHIVTGRAIAQKSGLPGTLLLHKAGNVQWTLEQQTAYANAMLGLVNLPLYIESPRVPMTLARLDSVVRSMIANYDVRLVLVDHLVRLDAPGQTSYEKQTARARFVARLQTEVGVPIVYACQLNREGEDEPTLRHLKDSGEIEESAAAVVILHDTDSNNHGPHNIIGSVLKNGNGPTGRVDLLYTPPTFTFA